MAKSWSLRVGNINLTAGAGGGDAESVPPETPFRILVMGDFRGQGNAAGRLPLAQRKPLRVDRDNFEEVLAARAPSVTMPLGPNPTERVAISFRELEDFEPDRLFAGLSVFESFSVLRRRLQDPARFADAAAEIKGWAAADIPKSEPPSAAPVSSENLVEQILGESEFRSGSLKAARSDWDRFLQNIVGPHRVARTDPRLPEFEAMLDEAISAQMRTILHHADFQALEAAWRGLYLLVRRLETDAQLQVWLLDVTREELAADLLNVDDLSSTGTYQQMVERTVGDGEGRPWAVVAGLYSFGPNAQDLSMLANLTRITRAGGAPFLAEAQSHMLGCPSLSSRTEPREWKMDSAAHEAWEELRRLPEAAYLGLILPRFLLRLPYGKDSRTTEQFDFEEMPAGSPHDSYLWGNPALPAAVLLGESFTQSGWNLRPGQNLEIAGLPTHFYQEEGETLQKPCAEVLPHNRAAGHILDAGLMPLLSVQNGDAARLARFQSIASPAAPLAGRWQ